MKSADEYTLKATINFPGMVARVFSPVLTEEERNRRMKNIHNAASNLMKEVSKK